MYFQCNFSDALIAYERALQVSVQREVRLLCLHEVGWSYVLLLQWKKAANAFLQLKRESRWSKSFYCYLSSGTLLLIYFTCIHVGILGRNNQTDLFIWNIHAFYFKIVCNYFNAYVWWLRLQLLKINLLMNAQIKRNILK